MNSVESAVETTVAGLVIYGLIVVLLVASLFLPPISLGERILSLDYVKVPTQQGRQIALEDGAQLTIPPEGVQGNTKIKFSIVPRSDFLEGSAGKDLLLGAENIPPWLVMKSPLYRIQFRGQEPPSKAMIRVPVPGDADPLDTIDLYSWDGDSWQWLPHFLPPGDNYIESSVDYLPLSVVVMQTKPLQPSVSADLSLASALPEQARDTVVEINPQGLYLDANGAIRGDAEALLHPDQTATFTIMPTLRNWEEGGTVRSDLIDNMLVDTGARQEHIQRIVELVVRNAYPGIDIDYRGINPELQKDYSQFISDLAAALHDNGKQLSVRLGLPVQVAADRWDTGVYDWVAIGEAADSIKVPVSEDTKAYVPGGEMDAMLQWAVGQVNRYKIQLLISTRSVEQTANGVTTTLPYAEALAPFSQVSVEGGSTVVNPGQEVNFLLAGLQQSTGIQFDTASGTYWFAYIDPDGQQRTVWIENAASIARKLQYVAAYNLRGVAVQNLLGEDNDTQVWDVIRKFLNLVIPPVENQLAVVWTVQGNQGDVLSQETTDLTSSGYAWTAPEEGGEYLIAAAISSDGNSAGGARSSVSVLVATPTPVPTATPMPTATPTAPPPTPTPKPKPVAEEAAPEPEQPAASTVPASTVGNLPFGYGIQVDPRGNKAANIGHIQALGFGWVKFQMPWKDVEPNPGDYQWGTWDDIIGAYSSAGIKVLLSIPKAPNWARPPGDDKSVEGPPADYGTFATFLGAVASRYAGKVQAIEVWNEQNLWYEGGGSPIPPDQYVAMLSAAYGAIKAANPDMIVVSGAPTPAGDVGGKAIDDLNYLTAMYAAGLKNVSDAIGAHPSGYNCPAQGDWQTVTAEEATAGAFMGPFNNRHHSWCFRGTMEGYRNVMVANGDDAKTIWPTEFGWAVSSNPHPGYDYALDNSLDEQAQWIVQAYQQAKAWGWVGSMFLWNLDYGVTAAGTELAAFGLLTPGPVPAYNALAGMPK